MPDNPSKLQNIQLPAEPSDGLGSGVVKTDCGNGGAIDSGPSPSAAKENVERRPCDCENAVKNSENGIFVYYPNCRLVGKKRPKNIYCRLTQRNLP